MKNSTYKRSIFVFDLDGTLADTKPGIIKALNYVLHVNGQPEIETGDEDKFIGPPIKESLKKYYNFSEEKAQSAAELYRNIYVREYICESKLYDGLKTMLNYLRESNAVIGIATMKTQSQTDAFLKLFDMEYYFDVIKTANTSGNITKSNMLEDIWESYHEECDCFYMIGDTIGDYMAAEKAGFIFISADYGYGDMTNIRCIHISKILELTRVLNCDQEYEALDLFTN